MKKDGDSSITLGPSSWEALKAVQGLNLTASNLTRASKSFGEVTARWAFEQWDLRKRARAKFARADKMFFDRDGLEMSSHEALARFHAVLFPPGERVADLTCGIGADLIALARDNPAVGFELDTHRAILARHNLEVHRVRAEVVEADCLTADWDFDYAFADPSRRSHNRRTLDPNDFQPRLDLLVERMATLKLGLIKLSPMLKDEVLRKYGKRVDFLSFGGECREAILHVGTELTFDGGFWAANVNTGRWLTSLSEEHYSQEEPAAFLLEADPAAIRSHSLNFLAQEIGASHLGDSNGYLTAPNFASELDESSWVRPYHVLTFGHADPKRIRAELRARDAFVKIVKLRAVREEPAEWVKKVRNDGKVELILVLYPVDKSLRFALVEAVPPSAETTP